MFNRSARLLRDLVRNIHYLPPWQIHLVESALMQLVREVQVEADTHGRFKDPEALDSALQLLYQMRDALWASDTTAAVKNGNAALRLLR